jgi:glyoxylate reductase
VTYHVLTNTAIVERFFGPLLENVQFHVLTGSETRPTPTLDSIQGILLAGHGLHVDQALLDALPNLRVISNTGAGVDHIDLDAARRRGIPVGSTPTALAGTVADMVFALLLAAARHVVASANYARDPARTSYDPFLFYGHDVHSSTLGIVGLGNIGRQAARRAQGFDMSVLYHNRKPNPLAEADMGVVYASLPDLLRRSDFVVLSVPLTEQTRGLIGRDELRAMKPTAVLVNVARGAVVDQEALAEALSEGWIAAAGLDVTDPEPLPRDHPLLKLESVVITPHTGSATHRARRDMIQMAADNLVAGLAGRELISRLI